jgi:hypothetical protein
MGLRVLSVGALACLVVACHFSVNSAPSPDAAARIAASQPGAFHYNRPLAAGRTLRLAGLNGAIEAAPSDDGNVDVRAAVRGKDPSRIRIVAREEERGVVVCVISADEPVESCTWDGAEHEDAHVDGDDARVDLFAKIPRGVALVAATMNGAVHARALDGDVRASTMNGDIEVATSGVADASTMNGSVRATLGTAPRAAVEFASHNGDVFVTLPAGTDASVEAHTMHGDIRASFPIAIETTPIGIGPKSGHATLGRGGVRISAQTMNGDIDVRAAQP